MITEEVYSVSIMDFAVIHADEGDPGTSLHPWFTNWFRMDLGEGNLRGVYYRSSSRTLILHFEDCAPIAQYLIFFLDVASNLAGSECPLQMLALHSAWH
ncbi:hypothetical protein VNO77_38974 [Canavalia gladiata]|uniref:Uncharacterized protein n=1 Tax=Canavalia gladiata TaxID=3824 RepID=A0AAN9PWQ2_CANGL